MSPLKTLEVSLVAYICRVFSILGISYSNLTYSRGSYHNVSYLNGPVYLREERVVGLHPCMKQRSRLFLGITSKLNDAKENEIISFLPQPPALLKRLKDMHIWHHRLHISTPEFLLENIGLIQDGHKMVFG